MAEPITCKAMVAFGVDDLREEEIIVAPPKATLPQMLHTLETAHGRVRQ